MPRYINTRPQGELDIVCVWKPQDDGWLSLCQTWHFTPERGEEVLALVSEEDIVAAAEQELLCPECVNAADWIDIPSAIAALRTQEDGVPVIWTLDDAERYINRLATTLSVDTEKPTDTASST